MNFYKHYLGDYGRKTAHLSLNEEGAYRRLLDHYYGTLSPLPVDLDLLLRIARASAHQERAAVESVAKQFFKAGEDGMLHNKRADEEIARWKRQAEINREVGRKGGRTKTEPKTHSVSDSETELETESGTEQEPSPEVRSQKLETIGQKPETRSHNNLKEKSKESARKRAANGLGSQVWEAYAQAYASRYGTEPVRNAKVNSQITALIARIGIEAAPDVVAWYVGSNNAYYVKRGHAIGILLADAEKVATECKTKKHGTEAAAREADGKQKRGQMWQELIEESRAGHVETK